MQVLPDNQEVTIRPLGEEDTQAFISLRTRALKRYPGSFGAAPEDAPPAETTRRNIAAKNEKDFILGYFQGNALRGTLGFVRHKQQKKRHKAFIWGVFVEPSCQGKGIGKALMSEALVRARKLPGLRSVHLSVSQTSQAALALYEGFGFEAWGVEVASLQVDGIFVDEIFMRLDLHSENGSSH